jgi:hypothetical protein
MSFDISRVTFDPWKDFSSVVMQQGRVQLDSDWNEWLAELTRRIRAGTLDCFGRAVYPSTTPNAFLITPTAGSCSIGVGRMYVDGLLVENHGLPVPASGGWIPPSITPPAAEPNWDPALDELVGPNPLDYLQQPYFPGVATQSPFPTTGGPFIVYLDVWQRCVTFLEYPDLVEKAVGVDTTGRIQTVWQVRLLDVSQTGGVTCTTPDDDIPAWSALIQPSAARLTTGVVQSSPTGPCCLAPNTGFTGMENQLYRVEIHQPGTASSSPAATFKWSRNDASIATSVTGISQGGTVLNVVSTGRDNVLRFNVNDWVEITDDWLELNGQPGQLRQVALVTDSNNIIQLSAAVPAATFPVDANGLTNPTRHTRLIKWDQNGKVYKSDGTTVWADLSAAVSTGDIPVPPPGTALILENGVTVSFDLNPDTGGFHVADYWNFAARTVDGTVENLIESPPRGIHHHYARLAVLTLPGSATDCRIPWPPQSGGTGSGCDCQSCVTADSHNGSTWTIQQAIDFVLQNGGGNVCLGPGTYQVAHQINIEGSNSPAMNLAVCGHGLPTLVPTAQFADASILRIQNAIDIAIEGIAFSSGLAISVTGAPVASAALLLGSSSYVNVERCAFGAVTDTVQLSPAISLAGPAISNLTLRENLFTNVETAIGTHAERLVLLQCDVDENQMYCSSGAFTCSGPGVVASEVRFANNFVEASSGFVLLGRGLDVTVESNTFSIAAATASDSAPYDAAIVCNLSQASILHNQISRTAADLTVTSTANNNGALTAGTYTWTVTAMLANGRESLLTASATATIASPSNATLQWDPLAGATAYQVYRTVANGATLLLVGKAAPGNGTTTPSYTDNTPDGKLQDQIPAMQNDGIVLGTTQKAFPIYGTQVIGNRITTISGTAISALADNMLLATVIAQNQVTTIGGNGISFDASAVDIDILANSLLDIAQLPVRVPSIFAIKLAASANVNVSENRIAQLGPAGSSQTGYSFGLAVLGQEVRIAGNQVTDIGSVNSPCVGIIVFGTGRTDVTDNDVHRATTPPDQPGPSIGLSLDVIGEIVNAQGNFFASFGSQEGVPGAVGIVAKQTCTFNNNQCIFVGPDNSGQDLVVQVQSNSILANGNRVQGPSTQIAGAVAPPSMLLVTPAGDIPPVTVIGNITTMGIVVQPAGMPAAMVPLNVVA